MFKQFLSKEENTDMFHLEITLCKDFTYKYGALIQFLKIIFIRKYFILNQNGSTVPK